MQKELTNEDWEKKGARDRQFTSSLNGNNNAVAFGQMCVDLGIYKYVNEKFEIDEKAESELITAIRGKQQMFKDWGNEGMDKFALGGTDMPHQATEIRDEGNVSEKKQYIVLRPNDPISDKQTEVIENIIKNHDVELPDDWRESMTKGEASKIISSYPKRKIVTTEII